MLRVTAVILFLLAVSPLAAMGGDTAVGNHWLRPIKSHLAGGPADLYPESCAQCHRAQYDDWKGALHSEAVGPGLVAQLVPLTDPDTATSCYFCHAPLSGQSEIVAENIENGGRYLPNGAYDERLKLSGVSCAVCHVRDGTVWGPFSRDRSNLNISTRAPHRSAQKDFFEDARFCAACHQLDEGYDLGGKLLVNTFREWQESEYGRRNISCQFCHMPGRRHLFKGIHSPEMVRNGLTFELERTESGPGMARLKITNSGVGHYFPTYVTPLVVVKGFLANESGHTLNQTVKEGYIGRQVTLDLSEERFDTRIPPAGKYEFDYVVPPTELRGEADRLVFEVWVFPDEFYNRFFISASRENRGLIKKEELQKAVDKTSNSGYLLLRKEMPLTRLFDSAAPLKEAFQ